MSLQSQVGEKLIWDQRCDNVAQFFHRLLHCLGVANSGHHINITRSAYETDSFVIGVDCEAAPQEAHGSGLSTHSAPLQLDLRDLGLNASDLPTAVFVTSYFDTMIQIEQDAVSFAQ